MIEAPSIHINSFVRRQTKESPFSYWTISDQELIRRITLGFDKKKPGYRDGVWLVPIDPTDIYSSIAQLKEGDLLLGEYAPRRQGEEPRQSSYLLSGPLGGHKMPAKSVNVVLYSHDVLAERRENESDRDFEVISVNGEISEEESPIPPDALIANHFELSGGTATNLSDQDFVALLKKSVLFWKDKVNFCPRSLEDRLCKIQSDRRNHAESTLD